MSEYEIPPLRQRIQSLVDQIKSTLLLPVRVATSKIAVRTYITSLLFFLTSFLLLAIAIAAYLAFYWSYIPRIGFSRHVHLQFDDYTPISSLPIQTLTGSEPATATVAQDISSTSHHPHPWGLATLSPDFASQQIYDIRIQLLLPRTPANTAAGNFMLDATLLGPSSPVTNPITGSGQDAPVLARSRRSAFLTYYSREVDLARKALRLPGLLTGLALETETIDVTLFEGVSFAKGRRNLPTALRIEVQSRERNLQIYACTLSFRARFRGLRWLMYNHRIMTAVSAITAFWITEMVAMAGSWLVLSLFIFPSADHKTIKNETEGRERIKQEEDDGERDDQDQDGSVVLSDTERTFPSYAGQPVLKYQSQKEEDDHDEKKIKREDNSVEPFPPLPHTTAEADDEDEEDDYVLDSGLGTSLESSAGSKRESSVRRRKSARGRTDD